MENLHYSRLSPFLFFFLLLSTQTQTQEQQQQDTPITRFQRYLQINTAHPNPDYSSAISFLKTQAEALNLQVQTLHFTPNKDKPILLLTSPLRLRVTTLLRMFLKSDYKPNLLSFVVFSRVNLRIRKWVSLVSWIWLILISMLFM
ncbi:hypothetical protein CMV_010133 [Castanea mollissima]|uniref:Uncharacterized protein n=1 Tax=Castanea mollissima TaxID=60419 RepID=A0A8J4R8F1_9ROSI|nr:hypothetical protein CMV_010133 [Castanea mollissima]